MKQRYPLFVLLFLVVCQVPYAKENPVKAAKSIVLPAPQTSGGMPLMQALMKRQSAREFSAKELTAQELSNLLWAADGVNRPGLGKRTAPSALNWQEVDIYVVKADGVFLYNAQKQALITVSGEDSRALAGMQPFVKNAPLNLVFVADLAKINKGSEEYKMFYAAIDTGFVSENVYLYCASAGLATVVRDSVEKDKLSAALKLKATQKIIAAQTVGYPK